MYGSHTVYLLLDTGATASLITHKMATLLNLKIFKTGHRAIQVDGESNLSMQGEVHTTFTRGSLSLKFSGLVVSSLGVDILAGTNFHIENDVYSRMSKGTISIGDSCTIQSSPPSLLDLDKLTMKSLSAQRLVKIPSDMELLPGDSHQFHAPPDIPQDAYVMIEPNLRQTKPFFTPTITKLDTGSFTISNQSDDLIKLKKHCQAFSVYTTTTTPPSPFTNHLDIPPPSNIPLKTILTDILFGSQLPNSKKKVLTDIIDSHSSVFQSSLPGYNNSFGPVFANFNFASTHRPSPQKLRSPNYGSHQDLLYNQKCQQLLQQGVLIDPIIHEIQPAMTHNSWVVKKPSAASLPWEKCTVKDVRLVVGLDPLNKFLREPPGKITKTETIYSALASWEFMGELDFSDFYFQIKFNMNTPSNREKLGYLCIRTAM